MFLGKLRAYGKAISRTRHRGIPDLLRLLAKRPALLAGVGVYEGALLASGRVDSRLKALATIKASALIGCPF